MAKVYIVLEDENEDNLKVTVQAEPVPDDSLPFNEWSQSHQAGTIIVEMLLEEFDNVSIISCKGIH